MKRNYFLYGHAGSGNHGCEAIVRSTCSMFKDAGFTAYSHSEGEDQAYETDKVCRFVKRTEVQVRRTSVAFLWAFLAMKFRGDYQPLNEYHANSALRLARGYNAAFSIGGDNYCYQGVERFMRYRSTLKRYAVKTVFWGCSVEPNLLDNRMRKDLRQYDLIVARESITYDTLKAINPNTVLAPDPAFTLKRQTGIRPAGLGDWPYIGINVSPLIQRLEQGDDITMENYRTLIRAVLDTTDRDIALIPHVVWAHNDDRIPLGQLYEEFKSSGRICLIEDQNCMQLKDIISGCEFFIGARTHATIAAYSTCVPTLVVGYSVKARGIARDIFGSEEGYVLPVQQLREKDDLTNAFKVLYARKDEIRKHLTDIMPGYIRGIDAAREAVQKL